MFADGKPVKLHAAPKNAAHAQAICEAALGHYEDERNGFNNRYDFVRNNCESFCVHCSRSHTSSRRRPFHEPPKCHAAREKAPLTQHALTVRTLAIGGAVVAALAATAVTGSALRFLLYRLHRAQIGSQAAG